jgi:DNA-binding LacI/PurR family transcriptional regulator
VIISQSRESNSRELLNLQYLTSRSIDGLIISVSAETKDFSYFKELHERGMPIVFFDRIVDEIETHKVIVDNYKGAYDATMHLISNGYKNIATLSNAAVLSIAKERLAGYKAALTDNGFEIDEAMIKYCTHGGMLLDEVETAINELLQLKNRPDAIVAAADKLTTNCLRMLKARGLKVPEDIALVGFSNTDLTELLDPPLSVIRQPAFEMGEVAMNLLLQLIESKRPVTEFETRVLTTELLVRGSTKKLRNKAKEIA